MNKKNRKPEKYRMILLLDIIAFIIILIIVAAVSEKQNQLLMSGSVSNYEEEYMVGECTEE